MKRIVSDKILGVANYNHDEYRCDMVLSFYLTLMIFNIVCITVYSIAMRLCLQGEKYLELASA
jgi:hypothetical protein